MCRRGACLYMNAVHHPHLLRCEAGVPLPQIGRAIFAQQPNEDDQKRLAYAPLNAAKYYETSATLGQYISFAYPAEFEELEKLVKAVTGRSATQADKKNVQAFFKKISLPHRFAEQVQTLGSRGARDYEALIFDKLVFIGIMVADNLTPADRKWWTQTGVIQITTCVQGLATVAVTTGTSDMAAFEIFSPFDDAVWDCSTNQLVKLTASPAPSHSWEQDEALSDSRRFYRIGTIVSAGVTEVNVLIDITQPEGG